MDPNVQRLSDMLLQQGIEPTLAHLNQLTACRFTAIYELVGTDLLNRYWYDRRGEPRPAMAAVVPFKESFCQIALREGEFRSSNTAVDTRVDYSPYKGVILSYHAVPLVDIALSLRGTLSHLDFVEALVDDEAFERTRQAARLLPPYLYAEHRQALRKLQE